MPGRRMLVGIAGAASLLALMLGTATAGTAAAGNAGATSSGPRDLRASHAEPFEVPGTPLNATLAHAGAQAPTDAQCRAATGSPCYSPQEIRHAYGVDLLLARGDDGKGETIVIVDAFGSPTIASDLASFDAGYGLPAPPSFTILAPLGTVPFNPTAIPDQVNWAAETTLDVEWAHAMAPDASIVLLTSPADETEGVQGMPQFDALLNFALDHHLGQVISQSWGATENTLFTPAGEQVFRQFEATYARAAGMRVTALASTGDAGSSNTEVDGTTFYPFPTVNFPASRRWSPRSAEPACTPTPAATTSRRPSGILEAAPAAAESASTSASRYTSGPCPVRTSRCSAAIAAFRTSPGTPTPTHRS